MALTCNIDARGKRARLINGIVMVLLAILAAIWGAKSGSVLAWVIAGFLLIAGGFAIFEARAGWCALRAMGFKTKI